MTWFYRFNLTKLQRKFEISYFRIANLSKIVDLASTNANG